MSLDIACQLADISIEAGAKEILLFGGEPTVWPDLINFNRYIKGKIKTSLITNAIQFADTVFYGKYQQYPNDQMGISLKASSFKKVRGTLLESSWSKSLLGIERALKYSSFTVSFMCSPSDCDIVEVAKLVKQLNGKRLHLTLYDPVCHGEEWISEYSLVEIKQMVGKIVSSFAHATQILDGNIGLRCSYPLCLWPKKFISLLRENGQISTGCMVSHRSGVVFGTDGSLFVCNHLPSYPMGKYGVDFLTATQLLEFIHSEKVVCMYDQLSRYPSSVCKSCSELDSCCGGCPLFWSVFYPKDAIPELSRAE